MTSARTLCLLGACALLCASPAKAFDPCRDASSYTPLEQRYTKGLLFKVEKCNAPASYIFGTVHLNKPEIDEAAADAFETLKKVQAAGFELADVNDDIALAFLKHAFMPPGKDRNLHTALGKDYFAKLLAEINFMEFFSGRYIRSEWLDRLEPWVAAIILQAVGTDEKGMVLDEKLWVAAILADKPVFGLETPKEQEEVFSTLSDALQIRMLKDEIDHYPELLGAKAALIDAYVARDARKMETLETETAGGQGGDKELEDIIRDRLLVKRNRIMEQRMLPRLKQQSVMISVGVMHLPGKDGVLHLLEQDGYFITPMP